MTFHSILKHLKKETETVCALQDNIIYSYDDLEKLSNQLANYLVKYQVIPSSKVVIFMRRSFDSLAAILALWKLGACYVPIDYQTPLERIKFILHEVKPKCVITEPALVNKFNEINVPILTLKDPILFKQTILFDSILIKDNEALGYIIYTSGSTGEPKGVMVTHSNIDNYVTWLTSTLEMNTTDVVNFNASLAFDFSITCTIAPLAARASILISNESTALNIDYYLNELSINKVTIVKWTPSYFKILVEQAESKPYNLSSLRYILLGGEPLATTYVQRWLAIYPTHCIVNEYGPTETTVGVASHRVDITNLNKSCPTIPIGNPINNTRFHVLTNQNKLAKHGEVGELLIGGSSVTAGYYRQENITKTQFIINTSLATDSKLYKTGDLVRQLQDNTYLYLGRIDRQIKVNGYRIEPAEIEYHLLNYEDIQQAVVTSEVIEEVNNILTAYIVIKGNQSLEVENIEKCLLKYLPSYMLPQYYFLLSKIPLTENGKIDFIHLKDFVVKKEQNAERSLESSTLLEKLIDILRSHMEDDFISVDRTFFANGFTSLTIAQIISLIEKKFNIALKVQDFFIHSTPRKLSNYISEKLNFKMTSSSLITSSSSEKHNSTELPIAIIAMDCKFPGADSCEELWNLCRKGEEKITFFKPLETTKDSGIAKEHLVYARGIIKNIDQFDADFFHFSNKEANLSDPQHRLMLEMAWRVLEKAGYPAGTNFLDKVGVYVSMNDSTYLIDYCISQSKEKLYKDRLELQRLTSSQFLATKLAYHLNCTGPAIMLQTACSSALTAVVLACQQLSSFQCNMALAGGVSLLSPENTPYRYQAGNIYSSDGHCRPYDEKADGTVFSNGLGMIVLKRLDDALRDKDTIISVIKGSHINNDGADKMSYTAPSVQGQLKCILAAQKKADVDPSTIQYVEGHGTGTKVGDPIEIEALSMAFNSRFNKAQYCALGSIKGNIGHTDVAAGIAGLIKTSLAIHYKEIPPSLHYTQQNPFIRFELSPFYINTRLQHWVRSKTPRRAAVSAFGVGGSNAHVILEEPLSLKPLKQAARSHPFILVLSAKCKRALVEYHDKLINYLEHLSNPTNHLLNNIACTLQIGRSAFDYRSAIVCHNISDAIAKLKEAKNSIKNEVLPSIKKKPKIVFLFPKDGISLLNLSKLLYRSEPFFKKHLDLCFELIKDSIGIELSSMLFDEKQTNHFFEKSKNIALISFSIHYALSQILMYWGIHPNVILENHSNKYITACVFNDLTLKDAIGKLCNDEKEVLSFEPPVETKKENDYSTQSSAECSKTYDNLIPNRDTIFIEMGYDNTMYDKLESQFVGKAKYIQLLIDQIANNPETVFESLVNVLKKLWIWGCDINWRHYHEENLFSRIPLPTYPFQRKSYWFDQTIAASKTVNPNKVKYTETQKAIITVWKRIFNVDEITEQDTFHSLGGDSLSALEFSHAIAEHFGIFIELKDFPENLTVTTAEKMIDAHKQNSTTISAPLTEGDS